MKLAISHWPIGKVLPFAKNARLHSESQVTSLKASITEFGFVNPCLVDADGNLIAGHARTIAAGALGMKTVPVIQLGHLTEKQAARLRIADNRIHDLSSWDSALLRDALQLIQNDIQLQQYDGTLEAIGFDDASLAEALRVDASPGPDETAPLLSAKPIVRKGDLWCMGDHRILCGDARSNDDVARLLEGTVPDLANCDPPYGISIVKGLRSSDGGAKPFGKVGGGKPHPFAGSKSLKGREHGPSRRAIIQPGIYDAIIGDQTTETAVRSYEILAALGVPIICMWGGNYYANALPPSRCWLVWDKENTGSFADVELAWTNKNAIARLLRHQWSGLIKASERGQKRVHPTQKPIALAEWVIETLAPKAKTVIDLFVGSGSALIACERKGLKFFGMELAPAYVQCAIERWQTSTGRLATLDGKTLDQVAKARSGKARKATKNT